MEFKTLRFLTRTATAVACLAIAVPALAAPTIKGVVTSTFAAINSDFDDILDQTDYDEPGTPSAPILQSARAINATLSRAVSAVYDYATPDTINVTYAFTGTGIAESGVGAYAGSRMRTRFETDNHYRVRMTYDVTGYPFDYVSVFFEQRGRSLPFNSALSGSGTYDFDLDRGGKYDLVVGQTSSSPDRTAQTALSFVFTDLGPVGNVPEPATWAMVIGGFGMTGAVMRRRRARKAVAG